MKLRSFYTTRQLTNDTLSIELIDAEGFAYDHIYFWSKGASVSTPAGYEDTPDGALAYAQKTFGIEG